MERLDRYNIPEEVYKNVEAYLAKEMPFYKLKVIFRASNHPDDAYLYQVVASKETDNTFACWTCWNESTQSLNYGHYNIVSEIDAVKICNEMYHKI